MKLRLRSVDSKQTQRIEVPTPFTLQHLKETVSQSISSSSSSSLHLSLNRKDELQASSPEASLQSLGIASGDLLFFTLDPAGFSFSPIQTRPRDAIQQPQTLAPIFPNQETRPEIPREPETPGEMSSNRETPIPDLSVQGIPEWPDIADSDMSDSTILQEQGGSLVSDSDNEETLEITSAETVEMVDGSVSSGKKFYERCFLRRILREELGDYSGDHKLLVIAVHAVLLESGFVGFDSVSGIRIDRFHLADEWPSNAFTMSLCYTLPELLGNGNGYVANLPESVVLKFQSLGHFVNIYGSLAGSRSGLYRVCLNENRFVPAIGLANSDSTDRINDEDGYPESEVFEFWKIVKDGLALPLLIDLCEKAGLVPPPCFMRLPAELKLKILESLPGVDFAKVGCVCSELRYLSSNNELWKRKFEEAFGRGTTAQESIQWKDRFALFWESNKKRKREAGPWRGFPRVDRSFYFPVRRDPNPFGIPPMVGGDYDRLPGLGVPFPFGQPGGAFPRFQPRRNFTPHCSLGGSNV